MTATSRPSGSQTGNSALSRFGIRGATHHYSGVIVLRDADFDLQAGEVHALVGENGSGKSTLIRILTGALQPSTGRLYMGEEPISFSSPADAQRHGVGVVHQDYHLFPDLSVAENVVGVGVSLPRRRWSRAIDKRTVEGRVEEMFHSIGIKIRPGALVRTLDLSERKFVEIARAMFLRPRFLILDEPTASLEPRAARNVLGLLDRLRGQGVGLAFVSHRLDEVCAIADIITVLRDGRLVHRLHGREATEEMLADLIVGTRPEPARKTSDRRVGSAVLRVEDLRLAPGRPSVSFELRRGEIFGLTGLLGAGAASVVRMLGGVEPLRGRAEMNGRPIRIRTPRDAALVGIGFIPEDRKALGLVMDQSVAVNISLASLASVTSLGVMRWNIVEERAESHRRALDIRTSSTFAAVKTLSGGNMQKVMLAKWLASGVRVLAIEEPTHGIDVKGKAQVHDLLRAFAAEGGSIVVASTDVEEVLKISHRIGVFRHGALTDILDTEELTHAHVTLLGARDPEHFLEALIESANGKPAEKPQRGLPHPGRAGNRISEIGS